MSFQVTGRLHSGSRTEIKSDKFKIRNFVLAIDPQGPYETEPNFIPFQLVNKNTELLKGFNKGDIVKVTFDIRGRLWTNPNKPEKGEQCFANNNAWRVEAAKTNTPAPVQQTAPTQTPAPQVEEDDLPF